MHGFVSNSLMNVIVQNQWIWIEIVEIRESRNFLRLISSTHFKLPSSHVSYSLINTRSETYFNEKSQLAVLSELRCQTYTKLWSSVLRLLLVFENALYFLQGSPAVNSLLPWIPYWFPMVILTISRWNECRSRSLRISIESRKKEVFTEWFL